MKFEFAKYTEVTPFALNINPEYIEAGYNRVFVCTDTNDYWLVRVLPGYNKEYEKDSEKILLERNNIPKDFKRDMMTEDKLRKILTEDDFSNWDIGEYSQIEDLIEDIDGGFGINNLQEQK
jgi:hypothetical protein